MATAQTAGLGNRARASIFSSSKGRAKEDPIMNECCQDVARDVKRRREAHSVGRGTEPRVGGDWVQMGRALRNSEDVYALTAG